MLYFWDQIWVTAAAKVDSGPEEGSTGETEVQPSPWVLRELSSGSDQKDWSLHCPGRGDLDCRRWVEGGAGEMSNLNILGKELGSGRSVRVPAGVGTCGGIGGMRGVQRAGSRNHELDLIVSWIHLVN